MKITAKLLSDLLGGTIEGDPDVEVSEPARIEDGKTGSVSFIANPKYEHFAYTTNSSVIIINKDLRLKKQINPTVIRVEDAYSAFTQLLEKYEQFFHEKEGREEFSFVDATSHIGKGVYIGSFAYIGKEAHIGDQTKVYPQVYIGNNVKIGQNTIIYPGVKIYRGCVIGDNCIIHAGTVIGSDGFGFAPQQDGSFKKIPQTGNVVVADNVEIGANTVIDRATVGSTHIKKGVKIDNLVQVAHNVEIGENTAIAAQAGVSGSTKLGRNIMVGGQAGFVGHISIADGVKINAQSGVSKSIKEKGKAVTGSPAFDYREALKSQAISKNLPHLLKRVEELERIIKQLQENRTNK